MKATRRPYTRLICFLLCLSFYQLSGQMDSLLLITGDAPSQVVEVKQFDHEAIREYLKDKDFEYSSEANYDESLWARFKRWLWEKYHQLMGEEASTVEKILSWAVILSCFLLLVYFLTRTSSGSIFRPNARRQKLHTRILDEKIDVSNIFRLIQQAESINDFRSAIRYRFIQALLDSEKNKLITLQKYKTISDYVHEFESIEQTTIFAEISRIFEFVWYGDYQISEKEYSEYADKYNQFQNEINP